MFFSLMSARIKIGLGDQAYNFQRLVWLEGRTVPG